MNTTDASEKEANESWLTITPHSTNGKHLMVTCDEVAALRNLSLTFTFVATFFLCYVITALLVHIQKEQLLVKSRGNCFSIIFFFELWLFNAKSKKNFYGRNK